MAIGILISLGLAKVAAVVTVAKVIKRGKHIRKSGKKPAGRRSSPDRMQGFNEQNRRRYE